MTRQHRDFSSRAGQRRSTRVRVTVEAFDAVTPPSIPEEGKVFAIGTGATGAWLDKDGQLAIWVDSAWQFHLPQPGWLAALAGSTDVKVWTGTAWDLLSPGNTDNLTGVGINTGSDATNRLAVSSPATLFSHEGAGHQMKINKASAADTGSLLFQTNWSGRAEMGLAGDDSFSIKISADGSTWDEALSLSPGMQVYHSGNTVGTVSATPGIGDALFETGSNANGGYVKFADGTMTCWINGFATANGAATAWTFPEPFATDAVCVVATALGATAAMITVDSATSTGADIHSFGSDGSENVSPSANLVAHGRWF